MIKNNREYNEIITKGANSEIQYIEYEVDFQNPRNAGNSIASLSMKIQNGKYDGTAESIENLTIDNVIL